MAWLSATSGRGAAIGLTDRPAVTRYLRLHSRRVALKCGYGATPRREQAPMVSRCRILVVEDQPLVAETIVSALGDDYDVVCGTSASEALEILERGTCDLVLLDCLLPGGRAADVIAHADRGGVPVVLMSGDMERIDALRGGNRPFLAKPFSMDALMRMMKAALPAHC
ncbi:MAG: response regulator [Acetobacteraceae bacterium]